MKKFVAIILCLVTVLSLSACKKDNPGTPDTQAPTETQPVTTAAPETDPQDMTLGGTLLQDFLERAKADSAASTEAIANGILENPALHFDGMTMEVEPGLLNGFGNAEITGFDQGVMFSPMIGSIPFVGYVFRLAEGTDGQAFVKTLEDNADLRWNICTEADEMVAKQEGDLVFFLMCPSSVEE